MKNTLFLTVLTAMAVLLASCEKIDMTEDGNNENTNTPAAKSLIIKASTTDDTSLPLPITLYAFDSNGKCKAQTNIEDGINRDAPSFSLPTGEYKITAVHIPSSYPTQATNTDAGTIINMPSENYASEAFYLGHAKVNLTSNNQTADITMKLQQAGVRISLIDVPEEVSSISVYISSPYTKINLSGELSDKQDVTIPCSKSGGTWTTGQFYILPVSSVPVLFTFNMKLTDGKNISYSFTYSGALYAGTPYNFEGKYSSIGDQNQLALHTNIGFDPWNSTVSRTFTFGPGIGIANKEEDIEVTEFPEDGTIWEGHVVALADTMDNNTCEVMLISLKEWDDVPSAYGSNPDAAQTKTMEYNENGMVGWSIPSKSEANILKYVYSQENNFNILNKQIETCGGTPLLQTEGSTNVRYLCENGTYAFGFKPSSSISSAGATVNYHLRLIKNITLKKQ